MNTPKLLSFFLSCRNQMCLLLQILSSAMVMAILRDQPFDLAVIVVDLETLIVFIVDRRNHISLLRQISSS